MDTLLAAGLSNAVVAGVLAVPAAAAGRWARRPALALADLAALLGLNGYLAYLFGSPRQLGGSSSGGKVAFWCYAPYVAWLAFAAYLNLGVGYLNGWDISDEALLRGRKQESAKGKKAGRKSSGRKSA